MSIEDEIRAKKEKMQADMREVERRRQETDRYETALRNAGMTKSSPELTMPPSELLPIIKEAMPRMQFTSPKIVRTMPDGRTLVRNTLKDNSEEADEYSFDVWLITYGGKDAERLEMWVFKNGAIAFCSNQKNIMSNMTWDALKQHEVLNCAAKIRSKIIDELARCSIRNEEGEGVSIPYSDSTPPSLETPSQTEKTQSDGCYIATAVYGSYDCPEVWVLRRYRDDVLRQKYLGRVFVKIYYTISPTLVKFMGNKRWFVSFWRCFLDKAVAALKIKGFSDQKYDDRGYE